MYLDHVTIRTQQLSLTRDFLVQVLGLEERPRPLEIQRRIPGHWLYADDRPMFHLIPSYGAHQDFPADGIDHVGIHLDNYREFRERLDDLKVPYSLMDLDELDERRVFFRTPEGTLLEAVFNETSVQQQVDMHESINRGAAHG